MLLQNVNNLINSVENANLTETSKLCMNNLVVCICYLNLILKTKIDF